MNEPLAFHEQAEQAEGHHAAGRLVAGHHEQCGKARQLVETHLSSPDSVLPKSRHEIVSPAYSCFVLDQVTHVAGEPCVSGSDDLLGR
ncbi:MAG: hypothetical protein QM733_01110 [Ilumatobacteraceae bacterium]